LLRELKLVRKASESSNSSEISAREDSFRASLLDTRRKHYQELRDLEMTKIQLEKKKLDEFIFS